MTRNRKQLRTRRNRLKNRSLRVESLEDRRLMTVAPNVPPLPDVGEAIWHDMQDHDAHHHGSGSEGEHGHLAEFPLTNGDVLKLDKIVEDIRTLDEIMRGEPANPRQALRDSLTPLAGLNFDPDARSEFLFRLNGYRRYLMHFPSLEHQLAHWIARDPSLLGMAGEHYDAVAQHSNDVDPPTPSHSDTAEDSRSNGVQAEVVLQATDLAGNPITQVSEGQEFLLQVKARNAADSPAPGVFSAFVDIRYDEARATASTIAFGAAYPNGRSGDLSTPGVIEEAGAFAGLQPLAGGEHLVFSVRMTADETGPVQFVSDPADVLPQHEFLVYGADDPLGRGDIDYGSASLEVVPGEVVDEGVAEGEEAPLLMAFEGAAPPEADSPVRTAEGWHSENTVDTATVAPKFTLLPGAEGTVWHDADRDGMRDEGEPGVAGFEIQLRNSEGEVLGTVTTSEDDPATPDVDETGRYVIPYLTYSDFYVTQVMPDGWVNSQPVQRVPDTSDLTGEVLDPRVGEIKPHLVTVDSPANHVVPQRDGFDGVPILRIDRTDIPAGRIGICSGTLLATGMHILTAAHCLTDANGVFTTTDIDVTFEVPGGDVVVTADPANTVIHAGWQGTNNNGLVVGNDVAVIQLDNLAPVLAERFDLYTETDEVGQVGEKVGYGQRGSGTGGSVAGTAGVKREGLNRYDAAGDLLNGVLVNGMTANSQLAYDFDNGTSANDALGQNFPALVDTGLGNLEVNSAPGDSGGPTFIDGRVAGITSYGFGFLGAPDVTPTGTDSSFGEISLDTRVSTYDDWINNMTAAVATSRLVGIDSAGALYTLNPRTAATEFWMETGLDGAIGLTQGQDGLLYTIIAGQSSSAQANWLYSIDPETGDVSAVGDTGLTNIHEGDLDVDPVTGRLYLVYSDNFLTSTPRLVAFDISGSTPSIVSQATIAWPGDLSAMSFDNDGNLFVVDTTGDFDSVMQIDKASGDILADTQQALQSSLAPTAGMDFDPDTGSLMLVDGSRLAGSSLLYRLGPGSGRLSDIGSTELEQGLSGLEFIPDATPVGRFAHSITRDRSLTEKITGLDFAVVPHSDGAQVEIFLEPTDLDGNLIGQVGQGQEFLLQAKVRDTRGFFAQGVFAAYLDVLYDAAKATASTITFGAEYPNVQTGDLSAAGLMDEVGAVAGQQPLGGGDYLLFSVRMTADELGPIEFFSDPADAIPEHEILVFGSNQPVSMSNIHYGSASLEVVPGIEAVDDQFSVAEDSSADLDILSNDRFSGGTPVVSIAQSPDHGGQASVDPVTGAIRYSPAADFYGKERFRYAATDPATGMVAHAWVTVDVTNVNDAPRAENDVFTVLEDSGDNRLDVLANDSHLPDPPETLTVVSVTAPSHGGELRVAADGKAILYKPAPDFYGEETVTYRISDGELTRKAQLTIVVENVNDAPQAADDQITVYNFSDGVADVLDVLGNDLTVDPGEVMLIGGVGESETGTPFEISEDGKTLLYQPDDFFYGTDRVRYRVHDGNGGIGEATVEIQVLNPWYNYDDPLDVNNDGSVTPVDVLILYNDLNGDGARQLTRPDTPPYGVAPFVDPSFDGHLTPIDPLMVINYLNSRAGNFDVARKADMLMSDMSRGPEGEASPESPEKSSPILDSRMGEPARISTVDEADERIVLNADAPSAALVDGMYGEAPSIGTDRSRVNREGVHDYEDAVDVALLEMDWAPGDALPGDL